MRELNLENVEEVQEYKRVVAGAYVCKITMVEDKEDKEYLRIEYDIAEGEFKNYYANLMENKGFWGANFIRSYKERALPFFKGLITSIVESNANYKWDNDEIKLIGKYVGLVLGEEEYFKNDGSMSTRLYVSKVLSVKHIKEGDIKIPEYKTVVNNDKSANGVTPIDDSDIPF